MNYLHRRVRNYYRLEKYLPIPISGTYLLLKCILPTHARLKIFVFLYWFIFYAENNGTVGIRRTHLFKKLQPFEVCKFTCLFSGIGIPINIYFFFGKYAKYPRNFNSLTILNYPVLWMIHRLICTFKLSGRRSEATAPSKHSKQKPNIEIISHFNLLMLKFNQGFVDDTSFDLHFKTRIFSCTEHSDGIK